MSGTHFVLQGVGSLRGFVGVSERCQLPLQPQLKLKLSRSPSPATITSAGSENAYAILELLHARRGTADDSAHNEGKMKGTGLNRC